MTSALMSTVHDYDYDMFELELLCSVCRKRCFGHFVLEDGRPEVTRAVMSLSKTRMGSPLPNHPDSLTHHIPTIKVRQNTDSLEFYKTCIIMACDPPKRAEPPGEHPP
jgi:hypothetical protein